jgi:hypothetical protein
MSPGPHKAADQPTGTNTPFQKAEDRKYCGSPTLCFKRTVPRAAKDKEGSYYRPNQGAPPQNTFRRDESHPRSHLDR